MKRRSLKHNKSGQVIIITALLVALLLLSTSIYVIETEKEVPQAGTNENTVFSYEDYLTRYPAGLFVDQARRQIEVLSRQAASQNSGTNSTAH